MSLLLLFQPAQTFMCWGVVATATSSFTDYNALLNTWDYWSTYTWGQIQASNRTWEYMAGNWFVTATTATSTWNDEPGGSCPII